MKFRNILTTAAIFLSLACNSGPMNVIDGAGPGSVQQPIIGGTPVTGSEYGAVVGLHRLTKRYGGAVYVLPFCTGTLISPTVVLTAGHCLDKAEDFAPTEPMKPNELAVYFGDSPGELDENGNYDVLNGLIDVEELLIHSSYDKFTITNDIGIIRLKSASTETPVPPLDSTNGFVPADVGTLTMKLVGFGEDENGNYGVKLMGDVTLSAILNSSQVEHNHSPKGICFGDSGGPALVTRDSTRFVGGAASYVTYPYCANTGAHTRVDAYEAWINDFVSPSTDPPGTCDGLSLGESCSDDSECCSGKCKGRNGAKTCK